MCGIAGWVDWRRDLSRERAVLQRMADALACRGPDAQGFWLSRSAAFAHRRLAVIDVEGGKQPMVRTLPSGPPCVLTFSGEIYNFRELRSELGSLGHTFETRSDTEVLLHAYMEWGPTCVDRLNGMFAFAVWDGLREELFLARDRLGIKPLFYAVRDDGLVFGSEPKALLAHPAIEPEVDDEGLAEIFALGPARTPGCGVYCDVDELRAGFTLRYTRERARVERYWQLPSRPHPDDLDTTTATIRALMEDIVRRQLISDVPVCTLLSGGLDSSAVTALAARDLAASGQGPVATYSIDFAESSRDFLASDIQPGLDAPFVEKVARWVGADHHDIVIDTEDLLEHFFAPLAARDLPSLGDMDVSLYLLCREIKKLHTVAVSGESADEVFGGYPWFHDPAAIAADGFPWRLPSNASYLAPDLVARLRPDAYVRARYDEAIREVPALAGEAPADARMRQIFYLNLTRFLPMLLDRKDRMSMAVGLEVRVPFCDHRLVEYLWNVPWDMKTFAGREKGILRRAMEGTLPDDVLWRKKSAYPTTYSPTFAAAMRSLLTKALDDPQAPILPMLDVQRLRADLAADAAAPPQGGLGSTTHRWAYLVQVNAWLDRYRVRIR